jgi:hypothetical protein
MQVVAHNSALLPQLPRRPSMEVAADEVERYGPRTRSHLKMRPLTPRSARAVPSLSGRPGHRAHRAYPDGTSTRMPGPGLDRRVARTRLQTQHDDF